VLAALLFATYSTFGPIGQDAQFLYVAQDGAIVRVSKDDPNQRTVLTVPTSRRIAAVDVDGDRVLYATAPSVSCSAAPTFPPDTFWVHYNCSLTDTEADHEIRSASLFGGDDRLVLHMPNGITELAHDDQWTYFLTPSNGMTPLSGRLFRQNKSTQVLQWMAADLLVSAANQHPFALTGDAVYVVSGTRLLRVTKSSNPVITDVAAVSADSAIASVDDVVYFATPTGIRALDAATGSLTNAPFPFVRVADVTFPVSILAAAPGVLVFTEGGGWTHTGFRGWVYSDLCANARLLLYKEADVYHSYFFDPLGDPAVAIDARGVYFGDRRVVALPSAPCHRRAASH
jgi:hypothetical protein